MATMIPDNATEPTRQEIQFATTVAIGNTGRENRVSTTGNRPRQALRYAYDLDDAGTALRTLEQKASVVEDIDVPLWHEERTLELTLDPLNMGITSLGTAQGIPAGTMAVLSSLYAVGDFAFINGYRRAITASDPTRITFAAVPLAGDTRARICSISPAVRLSRFSGGDIEYFAVNGGVATLTGTFTTFNSLAGGTAPTMVDVYPILNERPILPEQITKQFDQQIEVQDLEAGGIFQTRSDLPEAREINRLFFRAEPGAEWNAWKGFLNHIQGRFEPFLLPTFTRDMEPAQTNAISSDRREITVDNIVGTEGEFRSLVDDWTPGQYLRLQFTDGTDQIVQARAAPVLTASGSTEIRIGLTQPVTGGKQLEYASFVYLSRLASDTVSVSHFSTYSVISLTTFSLIADRFDIIEGTGEFDSSFDSSFRI